MGGMPPRKKIKKNQKKCLLFGASVVDCIHEKEILHQQRNPRIRRAEQSGLHVRLPLGSRVQRMDGERFLRGQIPSRRALRVDEKNRKKIA